MRPYPTPGRNISPLAVLALSHCQRFRASAMSQVEVMCPITQLVGAGGHIPKHSWWVDTSFQAGKGIATCTVLVKIYSCTLYRVPVLLIIV